MTTFQCCRGKLCVEAEAAASYQCESEVGSDVRFPFSALMSQSLLGASTNLSKC